MLVLSRERDQGIVFTLPSGERMRLVVVDVRRNRRGYCKVRLGVEAPDDVTINRDEVQRAIDNENEKGMQDAHETKEKGEGDEGRQATA